MILMCFSLCESSCSVYERRQLLLLPLLLHLFLLSLNHPQCKIAVTWSTQFSLPFPTLLSASVSVVSEVWWRPAAPQNLKVHSCNSAGNYPGAPDPWRAPESPDSLLFFLRNLNDSSLQLLIATHSFYCEATSSGRCHDEGATEDVG